MPASKRRKLSSLARAPLRRVRLCAPPPHHPRGPSPRSAEWRATPGPPALAGTSTLRGGAPRARSRPSTCASCCGAWRSICPLPIPLRAA
eukprot:12555220-Alexandrium_andersonii.AAC.1